MQCCRNVPSCVRNAAGGGYRMASVSNTSFIRLSALAYMLQKSPAECHHSVGDVVPCLEKKVFSLSPTLVSCLSSRNLYHRFSHCCPVKSASWLDISLSVSLVRLELNISGAVRLFAFLCTISVPLCSLLSVIIFIYSIPSAVICYCCFPIFHKTCVTLVGTSEKCETIFGSLDLF